MSSDILAAIDGALDDWETSPDAMRWTPGATELREPGTPDLGPLRPPASVGFDGSNTDIGCAVLTFVDEYVVEVELVEWQRAFIRTLYAQWAAPLLVASGRWNVTPDGVQWIPHHDRPAPTPPRLSIDGHAYRRRQRARARRRNR